MLLVVILFLSFFPPDIFIVHYLSKVLCFSLFQWSYFHIYYTIYYSCSLTRFLFFLSDGQLLKLNIVQIYPNSVTLTYGDDSWAFLG